MVVPLVGYVDRFSARPGERIAVKVSSVHDAPFRADLVRIICADPNPAGPGMKVEELPAAWAGEYPSRQQKVQLGSCGIIALPNPLALPDPCTVVVRVQPRLLDGRPQTVLEFGGAALTVGPGGAELVAADEVCASGAPMLEGRWYELRLLFSSRQVRLRQTAVQVSWGVLDSGEGAGELHLQKFDRIYLGARPEDGGWTDVLDGRLEDPSILPGLHEDPTPIEPNAHEVLAWWDFSERIPTQEVVDRGPNGWHGMFHNLPTRGVRGSRWRGTEMCWRHAPRDYAAVHLHADDLYDCGWETSFEIEIPDGMRSGVYGARLRAGADQDIVPFYVLPPRGTTTAPICFLAASFTYQAYANHARGNVDQSYQARRAAWGAYPHNPQEHPEYSTSTYNRHPDNAGHALSSMRRPILTMRPGFLTFDDQRGSGLRHFPADSHLTDWLEANGFGFDVVTDHDLDREGLDLIRGYAVVITGSHPEYHTPRSWDAVHAYTAGGGRLMYMGGNGFYWRIANSPGIPDVIEVRRAEGGIRAWPAEPGESYHQLDGAYGGLWRRNGRPPQMLTGVGFTGQGLFEGSHYRRLPAERYQWVWDGIEGEIIGDTGLSGGGAAGFELDRADFRLGTPPNAVILARSEGHQAHFIAVLEELLSHVYTVTGERREDLIRAEIVMFETANGGAVFATGSITYCGSLPVNGYDNPVSRLTANVLRRFVSRDPL
ncbi:MAG: N,N-dimethylformamidase large subunit [Acetobacteraceae bacterium]|nr:N,N-dimethylformamidase large subunit [Acetobacteraceae bacterium]